MTLPKPCCLGGVGLLVLLPGVPKKGKTIKIRDYIRPFHILEREEPDLMRPLMVG